MVESQVTAVGHSGMFRDDAAERHHVFQTERFLFGPRFAVVAAHDSGHSRLGRKDPEKRFPVAVGHSVNARAVPVSAIPLRRPVVDSCPRKTRVGTFGHRSGEPAVPERPDGDQRLAVGKEYGGRMPLIDFGCSLRDHDPKVFSSRKVDGRQIGGLAVRRRQQPRKSGEEKCRAKEKRNEMS